VAAEKPNLCFLDVGSSWDSAAALINEMNTIVPAIPVVAVSSGNDPDIILRSLRQGASEFLFQPFAIEQVGAALDRLTRSKLDAHHHTGDLGKVYCVMPGKGACGASTIACNLAFQLQKRNPDKKVLLADLDPATGTLSFLLKLKSSYSFVDALSHASQMDEDLWKALVSTQQGVDVILCPESPAETIPVQEAAAMIEYSREKYGTVILDVASPHGEWVEQIAKLCDELILVTTNELPALHSTQRALAYLEEKGIETSKVKLLVNRFDPNVGLDRQAIQTALNLDIFHVLPNDTEAIQKSLLEGKPVPSNTALGKHFAAIADKLAGGSKSEAKRSSILSGIFSVFDGVLHKG
jgi:pilus assembly protein CpaE